MYNTVVVLLGTTILGFAGAIVGCFLLLQKKALISDTISHATLPGVGIAFLVMELAGFNGKLLLPLLTGGFISSLFAIFSLSGIKNKSKVQEDAGLAIVLAIFFGIGVVVLSLVQRSPRGSAAGLKSFIYGKTASMLASDAILIAVISAIVLITVLAVYKELNLVSFDREWATANGFPVSRLENVLALLSLLLVIAGLQAVGLILMVAVLIIPAASARFWTNHIHTMTFLAAGFGMLGSICGTVFSSVIPNAPAGAIIVLFMGVILGISVVLGSHNGLIVLTSQHNRIKKEIIREHFFLNCYYALQPLQVEHCLQYTSKKNESYSNHFKVQRFFEIEHYQLLRSKGWSMLQLTSCLKRMRRDGFLQKIDRDMYCLTEKGLGIMIHFVRQHERKRSFLRLSSSSSTSLITSNFSSLYTHLDAKLRVAIENDLQTAFPVLFNAQLDVLAGEKSL